jgi:signal transduction histidine kinase
MKVGKKVGRCRRYVQFWHSGTTNLEVKSQASAKSPQSDSRFPVIVIVAAVLIIGWAVWWLTRIESRLSNVLVKSVELETALKGYQDLAQKEDVDPERARRESELYWQEASVLKREYQRIADHLEERLPELRKVASEVRVSKVNTEQQRNLQELRSWIEKEKERASLQWLEAGGEGLKQQVINAQASATNRDGVMSAGLDLKGLMADIERAYLRYVESVQAASENAGKPFVSSKVAAQQQEAQRAVARLAELVKQARQGTVIIEAFLQNQIRPEPIEIKQAFAKSVSPEEFARHVRRTGDGSSLASVDEGPLQEVQRTRYFLVATVILLGVLLLMELYRQRVVTPLRRKLVEHQGTIEEHQKVTHFEELVAGLAHEIRNPLTTISARLYTIQRKLKEGTPEYKDAEVIGSEIQRVNHILKEFMQVTRPKPPKLELMDAARLIGDVRELMAPQLQQRAVKLEVQPAARPRFYGDEQQLKQVLVNLVQNAAESLEREKHHGAVVLRAREDNVALKGTPMRVAVIEVEDNGPGIRPEVQGRLFEPFFSTKKSGTGLGLPISARIIDHHGGALDFKTQAGRGTVFRILLPAYDQK